MSAYCGDPWEASYPSRGHLCGLSKLLLPTLKRQSRQIRLAEEEVWINFEGTPSIAVTMLWVRDGHSGINRDMVHRMVSNNGKQYIHFHILIDA